MSKFYLFLIIIGCVSATPSKNGKNPTTVSPLSTLLKKFHQNDYRLAFERTEMFRVDKSLMMIDIRTFKYNRTTPVVNATFNFSIDVGYDMEVIAQIYRFASNEYREFPIRIEVNACEAIKSNTVGIQTLSTHGNTNCPFVKGKQYYFYNWAPEEANFPPFIPTGQYMMECQYMYHSKELVVMHHFGTVYRPIVY